MRGGKFTKNSLHSILKNEKYIGVYTYKDQVRVEGGIPAIVDAEVFAKVQEMLKVNSIPHNESGSSAFTQFGLGIFLSAVLQKQLRLADKEK